MTDNISLTGKEVEVIDTSDLTDKQKLFIQEYLIDLNGTQAAIRAGYSKDCACEIAYENLRKPQIMQSIQGAMQERIIRTQVTQDRVLVELAKIAFANLKDYIDFGPDGVSIRDGEEVDGSVICEVSETKTKEGIHKRVKLHDKMKALEMLGRHLTMFTDKVIQDTSNNSDIQKLSDAEIKNKIAEFVKENPALLAEFVENKGNNE